MYYQETKVYTELMTKSVGKKEILRKWIIAYCSTPQLYKTSRLLVPDRTLYLPLSRSTSLSLSLSLVLVLETICTFETLVCCNIPWFPPKCCQHNLAVCYLLPSFSLSLTQSIYTKSSTYMLTQSSSILVNIVIDEFYKSLIRDRQQPPALFHCVPDLVGSTGSQTTQIGSWAGWQSDTPKFSLSAWLKIYSSEFTSRQKAGLMKSIGHIHKW